MNWLIVFFSRFCTWWCAKFWDNQISSKVIRESVSHCCFIQITFACNGSFYYAGSMRGINQKGCWSSMGKWKFKEGRHSWKWLLFSSLPPKHEKEKQRTHLYSFNFSVCYNLYLPFTLWSSTIKEKELALKEYQSLETTNKELKEQVGWGCI